MPATKRKKEIPSTIRRSSEKAQRTWAKAHDSAVETYGEGETAHRVAYSALKHGFEKSGDRWEPKKQKGPSDPQAAESTPRSRAGKKPTAGGVDVMGRSREELERQARKLQIEGRSKMNKTELAKAIARKR